MANGSALSSILGLGTGAVGSVLELKRLDDEKQRIRGSLQQQAQRATSQQARNQLAVAQGVRGADRGAALRQAVRGSDDTVRRGIDAQVRAKAVEDAQISQLGAQQGQLALRTLAGLGQAAGQAGAVTALETPETQAPTATSPTSPVAPDALATISDAQKAANQVRVQQRAEENAAKQTLAATQTTPTTNQLPNDGAKKLIDDIEKAAPGTLQQLLSLLTGA